MVIYQKDLNQESLVPERVEEAVNKLLDKADEHHLYNWSNTHECRPKRFYQPETQEELEKIVAEAHEKGKLVMTTATSCSMYYFINHLSCDLLMVVWAAGEKLRCMGSGLSPNGLPFSDEGIVSLALMDKIKFLDLQRRRVTVEAGVRVEQACC